MSVGRPITIPPDVLYRSLGGETVLLNLETGETFSLDASAYRVWELIEEHGDRDLVEAALREEYDAPPDSIAEDVGTFLEELVGKGLVELTEDEP